MSGDKEDCGFVFVHNDMGEGFTHYASPECGCAPTAFPADMPTDEIMDVLSEKHMKTQSQIRKIEREDILDAIEHEIAMLRNPPPEYILAEDGGRMVIHQSPDVGMAEFFEEISAEIARLRYALIDLLGLHIAHHNSPIHSNARNALPDDWKARIAEIME